MIAGRPSEMLLPRLWVGSPDRVRRAGQCDCGCACADVPLPSAQEQSAEALACGLVAGHIEDLRLSDGLWTQGIDPYQVALGLTSDRIVVFDESCAPPLSFFSTPRSFAATHAEFTNWPMPALASWLAVLLSAGVLELDPTLPDAGSPPG